jgi:VIT1/CCC1 family predicted Fe2+/Mn2+ transporter
MSGSFGSNDGLVSNMSLVMELQEQPFLMIMILLTGIAGLLAGAISTLGEWLSVQSSEN